MFCLIEMNFLLIANIDIFVSILKNNRRYTLNPNQRGYLEISDFAVVVSDSGVQCLFTKCSSAGEPGPFIISHQPRFYKTYFQQNQSVTLFRSVWRASAIRTKMEMSASFPFQAADIPETPVGTVVAM